MNTTYTGTSTDVVIVGGGMVGVTLALLLAQQPELRITLLEAIQLPSINPHEPLPYRPSFDARNTALSRKTVNAYQALGIWQELQEHAVAIDQVHISERGRFAQAHLKSQEENVESFGHVIENAWLGLVLLKNVLQKKNVTVLDGATVFQIDADATQRTVSFHHQQENKTISAPLMIAADGAQSRCRELLGVSASHHDYQQVAIVTTVQTHLPHERIAYERFTEQGPLALLPLPNNRRSVVWAVAKGTEDALINGSDEAFLQQLQTAFGRRAGKFIKTAARYAYPLNLILAQQQALPRAVILGNAAHTLHPVAGQGFNLCLRDCLLLSQFVIQSFNEKKDWGDFAQLKKYEEKRLQDQHNVAQFSDWVVRGFSHANPLLGTARNMGLWAFDVLPLVKPLLARYAMGINQV